MPVMSRRCPPSAILPSAATTVIGVLSPTAATSAVFPAKLATMIVSVEWHNSASALKRNIKTSSIPLSCNQISCATCGLGTMSDVLSNRAQSQHAIDLLKRSALKKTHPYFRYLCGLVRADFRRVFRSSQRPPHAISQALKMTGLTLPRILQWTCRDPATSVPHETYWNNTCAECDVGFSKEFEPQYGCESKCKQEETGALGSTLVDIITTRSGFYNTQLIDLAMAPCAPRVPGMCWVCWGCPWVPCFRDVSGMLL